MHTLTAVAHFEINTDADIPEGCVPILTLRFAPAGLDVEVEHTAVHPVDIVLAFLESVDPHTLQQDALMRGEAAISAHQVMLEVLADYARAQR